MKFYKKITELLANLLYSFVRRRYLNRWIVMGLDLFVLALAHTLAHLFLQLVIPSMQLPPLAFCIGLVLPVGGGVFFLFRLPHGIIRFSSYREGFRILLANLGLHAVLFGLARLLFPAYWGSCAMVILPAFFL